MAEVYRCDTCGTVLEKPIPTPGNPRVANGWCPQHGVIVFGNLDAEASTPEAPTASTSVASEPDA